MSPVQDRYRILDARGSIHGQVDIAPGFGDEDLVSLEASSPTFTGPPREVRLVLRQKDLLGALGAEPDESDYREVLDQNERLGRKLSAAVSEKERLERELSREAPLRDLQDAATPPATDSLSDELRTAYRERAIMYDSLRLAERDLAEARANIVRLERDWNATRGRALRMKRELFVALGNDPKDFDPAVVEWEEMLAEIRERGEEPRAGQDQIDRSWALTRASGIMSQLAAVGALPEGSVEIALWTLAEWILSGEKSRG